MPNHLHLVLVSSDPDGLRRALERVHRGYTGIHSPIASPCVPVARPQHRQANQLLKTSSKPGAHFAPRMPLSSVTFFMHSCSLPASDI
jgi:hypothetical protein